MNPTIEEMMDEARGRYLEPAEQSALIDYAETLEERLAAMRAVEEHEQQMVDEAVEKMFAEHPDAASRHEFVEEKAKRDMILVVRYCALAMIRDDVEALDQQLLHWFATIVDAFEMRDLLETSYLALIEAADSRLDEQDFDWIAPYFQRVVDRLGVKERAEATA